MCILLQEQSILDHEVKKSSTDGLCEDDVTVRDNFSSTQRGNFESNADDLCEVNVTMRDIITNEEMTPKVLVHKLENSFIDPPCKPPESESKNNFDTKVNETEDTIEKKKESKWDLLDAIEEKGKLFKCDVCDLDFINQYNLRRHVRGAHKGKKKMPCRTMQMTRRSKRKCVKESDSYNNIKKSLSSRSCAYEREINRKQRR